MAKKREPSIEQYRSERFVGLGFTLADAEKLANAKTPTGHFVDYYDIAKMLDNGCPPQLAVEIMT